MWHSLASSAALPGCCRAESSESHSCLRVQDSSSAVVVFVVRRTTTKRSTHVSNIFDGLAYVGVVEEAEARERWQQELWHKAHVGRLDMRHFKVAAVQVVAHHIARDVERLALDARRCVPFGRVGIQIVHAALLLGPALGDADHRERGASAAQPVVGDLLARVEGQDLLGAKQTRIELRDAETRDVEAVRTQLRGVLGTI
mmetsp:Transcript_50265/g.116015  ORF Transcript_50265/g.116015 Transcript_50265/m.116015 type:complete len:200 (+) Transcript_50265:393-992(+)